MPDEIDPIDQFLIDDYIARHGVTHIASGVITPSSYEPKGWRRKRDPRVIARQETVREMVLAGHGPKRIDAILGLTPNTAGNDIASLRRRGRLPYTERCIV